MNHKIEITAPAGDRSTFFAALNSGADAIYLGLQKFSARQSATNFSIDDLCELVPLANKFRVKVIVTINTIIKEHELFELVDYLTELEALGVYAVSVQDLGVVKLIKENFPNLRIHASTQMAIHNKEGVIAAHKLGINRVILARELTLDEISGIRALYPREEMELEVFCHGSLCYCYSGLCLFGGIVSERSGNRGTCPQLCRDIYLIDGEHYSNRKFIFNTRDLDTRKYVTKLAQIGVDAFKIEGRKKDAQYVATVVSAYKKLLNKKKSSFSDQDIAFSFMRRSSHFFLDKENQLQILDTNNSSHLGIQTGRITAIKQNKITFRSKLPLERFDMLRVMDDDGSERAKFAIHNMFMNGQRISSAKPNSIVEIEIPKDQKSLIKINHAVYKIRSENLRQRVEHLTHPPKDQRLIKYYPISLDVNLSNESNELTLEVSVKKFETTLSKAELKIPAEDRTGDSNIKDDIKEVFGVFGTANLYTKTFNVNGNISKYFVQKSHWKKLKQELSKDLQEKFLNFINQRKTNIKQRVSHISSVESFMPERASDWIYTITKNYEKELPALKDKYKEKLRVSLPAIIRSWETDKINKAIQTAIDDEVYSFELNNISHFEFLAKYKDKNLDLSSGYFLYCSNHFTALTLKDLGINRITLNIEDNNYDIKELIKYWPVPTSELTPQITAQTQFPLFTSEICLMGQKNSKCIKNCQFKECIITNSNERKFVVRCKDRRVQVFNYEPYSTLDNA